MAQAMIPISQVEEIARQAAREQTDVLRQELLGEVREILRHRSERQMERVWEAIRALTEAQARTEQRLARLEDVVEKLAQAQARTEQRVEELAQAQARTEQRVEELAQAQARTEQRLTRLEDVVEKLAQAQARTEQRLTRLEDVVEKLAQAQARTEQRVEELAQAQARTEQRLTHLEDVVEKLAQAQARTESAVQQLTSAVIGLRKEVGALAENIGLGLEEIAYTILPSYIEYAYGFHDVTLQRTFVGPPGQEVEVNLYGKAFRDGEEITLAGEVKNRIRRAQVKEFVGHLNQARRWIEEPLFPFMFAYWIHPSAEQIAVENGIELIVSHRLIHAAQQTRRRGGSVAAE